MAPQNAQVLEIMTKLGHITPREAVGHGIYRLAARIYELRNEGYTITTERLEAANGGHYAKYSLATVK